MAATAAASATSAPYPRAVPPGALAAISAATASAFAWSRSTTATLAPSAAHRSPMARPMPLAPPVTTTTALADGTGGATGSGERTAMAPP